MPTLRIKIDGLCVMLPDKPYPAGTKNELWVLFVDARKHPKMPHNPRLKFPPGNKPSVWKLAEEHLDFKIFRKGVDVTKTGNLKIRWDLRQRDSSGNPKYDSPQSVKEQGDFSWVPSITAMAPMAKFDRKLLDPEVKKPGMVSRLKLTDGTLRVSAMADDGKKPPKIEVFKFEHGGAPRFNQAIAEEVILEIPILVGDEVRFSARELKSQTTPTRKDVVLKSTSSSPNIEVEFRNPPAKKAAPHHFPMLFNFLDPPLAQIPTMSKLSPGPGTSPVHPHAARMPKAGLKIAKKINPDACPFVQFP